MISLHDTFILDLSPTAEKYKNRDIICNEIIIMIVVIIMIMII